MMTRIWHGRTSTENTEFYRHLLQTKGTEEYLDTPGNVSVKVWEKQDTDCTHFWTVSEWTDLNAIKVFAGSDYEKAKYYPEDKGRLLEFEDGVNHYVSYDVSNFRIKEYQRQLVQLYHGGNWLAESYSAKLKDVQDYDAFKSPIDGVHSIAEIVWHVIYWRMCCIHWIDGDTYYKEQTVNKLNFLPLETLRQKGWNTLQSELSETQTTLIERLNSKRDSFLLSEYQPGYTFNHLLEGQIHHDVYHLGQIGLVIKILSLPPDTLRVL